MDGVFALDKPAGRSSAHALAEVKRRLGVSRLGHAGTLDPMATGVLVVLIGEATKIQNFVMADAKAYEAEVCFGATTDTLDSDGKVTEERDASHLTEAAVREVLPRFVGTLDQVPPAVSALHVDGERSYDLARAGKAVTLAPRPVTISALTLESWAAPRARITVACGKGTYIRSLARDLGAALGTVAHLTALRRTRVGVFTADRAVALDSLGATVPLTSLWDALAALPAVDIDEQAETWARQGKSINLARAVRSPVPLGAVVRLGRLGRLIAVAEQTEKGLSLLRVFS